MCRYYNAAGRPAFGEAFYQMSRRKIFYMQSELSESGKKAGMVIMPVFACIEKILILVPLHNEWEV